MDVLNSARNYVYACQIKVSHISRVYAVYSVAAEVSQVRLLEKTEIISSCGGEVPIQLLFTSSDAVFKTLPKVAALLCGSCTS